MTDPPKADSNLAFLFTDIEGSTRLWERHPVAMREALARHDRIFADSIAANGGQVFKTVGDAFCAAFERTADALGAAIHAQQQLSEGDWPETGPIRVRMAIHRGEAQYRDGDYYGPTVNRVARILSAGHGGQILLSQAVRDDIADASQALELDVLDLASHRLKDLGQPEHLWQVLHPSLDSEFPPLRSLQAFANNIPAQVSSFIGREKEMAAVKELLGQHRLVTLVGPGGCGKTRLALQVSADVLESYSDGAWLVELAAIGDPSLVVQQAATALGLRESPGVRLDQTLLDHLQNKTTLLVLDNCEHVIDESAQLAELALSRCPGLTILATSQEPLGISGERSWTIPSMPQPETAGERTAENPTLSLLQYDSVRLFVERAREAGSTFAFSEGNAPAVASICRRLDGIPLAIELAAAATRSLHPSQVSERLDDRFRLLTGGRRTAPERQKTLRGMIDWSYELLTEGERLLLTRLSIFAGGWTLEAAEEVCADNAIDRHDVVDLLGKLVSKSLVVTHDGPDGARYGMLESIRQYSDDKRLRGPEDERGSLIVRHVEWCVRLVTTANTELKGGNQTEWLRRMESEHDNVRVALDRCAASSELGQEALLIVGRLFRFWEMRGHISEGLQRTQAALVHPGAQDQNENRALALNSAGNLSHSKRDLPLCRNYYEAALAIRRNLADPASIATSLGNLGALEYSEGNYEIARRYLEEGLAISRTVGDPFSIAMCLANLGANSTLQADYRSAKAYFLESLQLSRRTGNRSMEAKLIHNIGHIECSELRFESAIGFFKESVAISLDLGDEFTASESMTNIALAQLECGDLNDALRTVLEAERLADAVQDKWVRATAKQIRAGVELALGNRAASRELCAECLEAFQNLDDSECVAATVLILARIEAANQKHERAAALLGIAETIRAGISQPISPHESANYSRAVADTKAALGEERFEEAWERGKAMSTQAGIEFAGAIE